LLRVGGRYGLVVGGAGDESQVIGGGAEEAITTAPSSARSPRSPSFRHDNTTGVSPTSTTEEADNRATNRRSVIGQWVSELTGTPAGVRVPTSEEITQLSSMFPDTPRERVIRALQRRYGFNIF
jgi:hypothetical protein